jgi:hypothetical protein
MNTGIKEDVSEAQIMELRMKEEVDHKESIGKYLTTESHALI